MISLTPEEMRRKFDEALTPERGLVAHREDFFWDRKLGLEVERTILAFQKSRAAALQVMAAGAIFGGLLWVIPTCAIMYFGAKLWQPFPLFPAGPKARFCFCHYPLL